MALIILNHLLRIRTIHELGIPPVTPPLTTTLFENFDGVHAAGGVYHPELSHRRGWTIRVNVVSVANEGAAIGIRGAGAGGCRGVLQVSAVGGRDFAVGDWHKGVVDVGGGLVGLCAFGFGVLCEAGVGGEEEGAFVGGGGLGAGIGGGEGEG